MEIVQQYTNEVLCNLLQAIEKKNNDIYGLLELLLLESDESENKQKVMLEQLASIKQTAESIDAKIDIVLQKLNSLERDFADLKNENRDIEQKLMLMTSKLSKLEVSSDELEDYYALSQSVYNNWEEFDNLTKQFIPLAEYLYSKLQKYEKIDYSPVILELCRAIENEFLLKIFRKYTLDLVDRKGKNLDSFLTVDRATFELKDKTTTFVKVVAKAAKTGKPEFTLGQMNAILSITLDAQVVRKSPLLTDFVNYLKNNTESNHLLDSKYIKKINDIVNKYRNPSAHSEFMTIEKANECRKIMPDRLDYLMECLAR